MPRASWIALAGLGILACRDRVESGTTAAAEGTEVASPPQDLGEESDGRPKAGRLPVGEELTAEARAQNAKGKEPRKPTRRGRVSRAMKPTIEKTVHGFVARLGGQNTVTPVFHEGRVLAGAFSTYDLHAVDATTGAPEWSIRLSDDGPTAPTCRDGICVFNTYSCTMFGVAADTGKHLWSWYLGSPQLATPVISGDLVYSSYPDTGGPPEAPYVIGAFDLRTGAPVWRRWIDSEVNATPVAYGGKIYVATRLGTLYELGAVDGEVVSARRSRIASPPVITADGLLFARDAVAQDSQTIKASRALFPELEGRALAVGPVQPRPRPLVAKSRLISIDGGMLVARNKDSGRALWSTALTSLQPASVPDPLIYAGKSVLMATASGSVVRFDASTGETVDSFELAKTALSSQPIAVDGWLYAGTADGSVVGYDTGQRELTGWAMQGGTPDRQGTVDPEGT
ncbi:MAG: PQQ-binding-like beta-propeller repeat protein [Myxococcales bacterium]|nr:PQQ-binding-like beta-propeller repeat protein [Myxococcales bacterium]